MSCTVKKNVEKRDIPLVLSALAVNLERAKSEKGVRPHALRFEMFWPMRPQARTPSRMQIINVFSYYIPHVSPSVVVRPRYCFFFLPNLYSYESWFVPILF
jgi:hypothetical protein